MSIMSFQICILPELCSPKVASKQGSRSMTWFTQKDIVVWRNPGVLLKTVHGLTVLQQALQKVPQLLQQMLLKAITWLQSHTSFSLI